MGLLPSGDSGRTLQFFDDSVDDAWVAQAAWEAQRARRRSACDLLVGAVDLRRDHCARVASRSGHHMHKVVFPPIGEDDLKGILAVANLRSANAFEIVGFGGDGGFQPIDKGGLLEVVGDSEGGSLRYRDSMVFTCLASASDQVLSQPSGGASLSS